jgi:hypothetical protein
MGTLEQTLQELHEVKKAVEISWLWDGGVDVRAGDEERNFGSVAEVRPWLSQKVRFWYGLKPDGDSDVLETELQKIYDSEINITIRTGGEGILVALGNDFTGFAAEEKVTAAGEIQFCSRRRFMNGIRDRSMMSSASAAVSRRRWRRSRWTRKLQNRRPPRPAALPRRIWRWSSARSAFSLSHARKPAIIVATSANSAEARSVSSVPRMS